MLVCNVVADSTMNDLLLPHFTAPRSLQRLSRDLAGFGSSLGRKCGERFYAAAALAFAKQIEIRGSEQWAEFAGTSDPVKSDRYPEVPLSCPSFLSIDPPRRRTVFEEGSLV